MYFHPRGGWQGRGKNRRRAGSVTIMRAGSLEPGWYHELAQQAEAADGLTARHAADPCLAGGVPFSYANQYKTAAGGLSNQYGQRHEGHRPAALVVRARGRVPPSSGVRR